MRTRTHPAPPRAVEIDAGELRRLVIEESKRAHVGHIGSSLSIADILAVLYGGELRGVGTGAPGRDVFILSKGHAALALYCALHLAGHLERATLATYCADASSLGVHPEHQVPGIEFSTGSLGHGLSLGAGSALGARVRGLGGRTYVLVSDAELDEGSLWEAVMFSAHHRLDNLYAILDANGQQALGPTAAVLDLEPVREKWEAFGWVVREVDGHDAGAIRGALAELHHVEGRPKLLVARTTAGKGVSFMEGRVAWHYLPMSDEQYATAMAELGG